MLLVGIPAGAWQSEATAEEGTGASFLLVSDPVPEKVYIYRVPDMKLTGQLDEVNLGSAHAGTIALPDGRILMGDVAAQRILAVRVDRHGRARIERTVWADLGPEAPWSAVDPSFSWYALASNHGPGSTGEMINLVNLKTFRNIEIPVPVTGEDAHPFLAGSPLTLFVSIGNRVDAFPVAKLVKGDMTPAATFANDTGLHHGSWISPATGKLGLTADAGLDVIGYTCRRRSCGFGDHVGVPWNADGFTGSARAFRPRLFVDGAHVGNPVYVSPLPDPTAWPGNAVDFHVTDLARNTARRVHLGHGQPARGFGLSRSRAVFSIVHPRDMSPGDELLLLDVRPHSRSYLKSLGSVQLPHMANGPVTGQAPDGFSTRFVSITPDGHYAFATSGGDGKLFVVDTPTLDVRSVPIPTSLQKDAYLNAFELGLPPVDLMGR